MHAIGGRGGRRGSARRREHAQLREKRRVVIDDLLERGGAVVVEVGRRVGDAAQLRHVELVPVIEWRRSADEPGQQCPARIRARPPGRHAAGKRDLVGPRIPRQPLRTGGEHESRRRLGINRTRALCANVLEVGHRSLRRRLIGPPMTLRARALEHGFSLLLARGKRRVGIGQERRSRANAIGELFDLRTGEQGPLKRRQIVEHALGGGLLRLRMVDERTKRLLLQRADARIELVATEDIWLTQPGVAGARPAERHVQHRRHAAPDVDVGFGRWEIRHRIDQPDIGRQGKLDADQAIDPQIDEVMGLFAVDAEVIGIDGPEERVVRVRREDTD